MKKLLIFLLLLYTGTILAQNVNYKIDKVSFLIGTLDDYMGHQQTFTAASDSFHYQMVDIYYKQEKKTALLIDSLFRKDFSDLRMTDNAAHKGIKLYSAGLSGIVNAYYDFKPSGSRTLKGDTVYIGYLKKDKFTTQKQKLSFLAGAFLRYGRIAGSNKYELVIANSVSKTELCERFLKELKCKNVEYEIREGFIPVGHRVFFEPSGKVRRALNKVERY